MYYCNKPPPAPPPQTGLGIAPIIAAAGITAASGLFSSFFGNKGDKDALKAAEAQIRAEKQLAVTQIESAHRADTVRALTIGGIAAIAFAGILIIGAVKKRS